MSNKRRGISRILKDKAGGTLIEKPRQRKVFADGGAVAIKNQNVAGHGTPPHANPIMVTESRKVFVNRKGVIRKNDSASCGHKASGSRKVFAS